MLVVVGIGTDLIEIERIEKALTKNTQFIRRIYSLAEQEWLGAKPFPAESAAANFAGKEAVLKVFGTGLRNCQFCEIEILRNEIGKPYVVLYGGAKLLADSLGIDEVQISLSHTKKLALAYAIGIRSEQQYVVSK